MSLYHNAVIISFIWSIALAASSKPHLNLHLDLQLSTTPLPTTLEQPQLCPTMDTAGSARESTHTERDDSSSNVDEYGSVSKRPRKLFTAFARCVG